MLSHHEFLEKLALQLIWPDRYDPRYMKPIKTGTTTAYSGVGARAKQKALNSKPKGVAVLIQKTIGSNFPQRFDGIPHPFEFITHKYCQYFNYKEHLADPSLGKKPKPGEKRKIPPKHCLVCKVCQLRLCEHC